MGKLFDVSVLILGHMLGLKTIYDLSILIFCHEIL